MPERDLVFFSYNREDNRWLKPLRGALEPYVLVEKLKTWSDRQIEVGSRWDSEIQDALARTRVAILFLSQPFFGSRYIRERELPVLIADADKGLLTLVCVPVGHLDEGLLRESKLAGYQFSMDPAKPLSARRGNQREKAIVQVAMHVDEAYRRLATAPALTTTSSEAKYREAEPLDSLASDASRAVAASGRGRLFGVPDLDEQHYVERPDVLAHLKQLLLEGTGLAAGVTSAHRAERIGLHGMGGMGKTVLAQAFCHDPLVRSMFPDGIHWLTLGQDPALLAEQTRLLKWIDERVPVVESVNQARELLKARLAGKRALLVIDDVWRAGQFNPFDVASGQSRVLITTRDAGLLTLIGAREEALDRLDEPQSLRLMAEWAGLEVTQIPDVARRVAEQCGYLPLALALAGAQVADGVQWSTLVEQLESGKIEFLDHDYGSVFDSLGRSVDALSEDERARYLELAVFPEDARIPPQTVARLWSHSGGLNEAETEKLIGRLHRKALLKRVQTGNRTHISFHDLQHDFVRIRSESPQSLSSLLLDAYRSTLKSSNGVTHWSALPPDEPYLWTRLAAHLVEAGQQGELEALLLSIEWIRAKLTVSTTVNEGRTSADINALLADYDYLSDVPEVSLVQRALRMSSHVVSPNPNEVNFQLFGRLGTSAAPTVQQLCREAMDQQAGRALVPTRSALTPPGALVLTLAGHKRSVNGAFLLADGRRALTWSNDGSLKMWDLERGEALHTLDHGGPVKGARLLADGQRALSWSDDVTLKLWDLERGEALHTLVGHEDSVTGALLLADGRRALSRSDDRTLKLWDLERGEALHTLTGHARSINGALPLADSRRALSWSTDGTLRLWDLERGEALHTLAGHESPVNGALLLADGRRALSWSDDRTLRLWDLERGEALHTLVGHEGWVNGALLLADDQRALTWSDDLTLRLWDLERGEALHTLSGHEHLVESALPLADGRRALSWSGDGTLKLWDLERGEALHTLAGHARSVDGALLLADGRRVLSWSNDGTLKLWDLERAEALHTLAGHESSVKGAMLLADGRRALSWSDDRTLKVWDLERAEALHTLSGHSGPVQDALLLADGRRVLSWSDDGTLRVWELERGEALRTLSGPEGRVKGALLLADGRRALTWFYNGTLKLWDLDQGEALHTLAGHKRWVTRAMLLADGRRALTSSADGTLRLWDLDLGEPMNTLAANEGSVDGAMLLADGRRALTWLHDGTLKLWDLERGEALRTLSGPGNSVKDALLLADGRRALSWSYNRTLTLWNLERGEALHTLSGHEGWVNGALLMTDGRRALSWSDDRTLKLWDLERGEQLRTLTGHESSVNGALELADGRRALSWSDDHTLRLFDLDHGLLIASYFADATLCPPAVDETRGRIFAGDGLGRIHIIRLDVGRTLA